MPKTRQQKSLIKDRLVAAFKAAKSVVFVDYRGLNVSQANALRKTLREAQVDYIVAKKTLLNLAAKEVGLNELEVKHFPGMIGAAFGLEDEIAPAKALGNLSKISSLKLVGGVFEGASASQEQVIALSKLPTKKELLAKVVGTIYAPVSAFVRVLNAVRESKENSAA